MAVLVLIVYYAVGFNPSLDPFRGHNDPDKTLPRPNPVDALFHKAKLALYKTASKRMNLPSFRDPQKIRRLDDIFNEVGLSA